MQNNILVLAFGKDITDLAVASDDIENWR